ncbi:hypothetical protein PSN45_004359 [Yamadazyma tenuis]|uniref:Ribosomal protein L10 n=1 Tax=Candida tenuis (strain ATCC 10573 / BCRC 21748 / CBS 615 / JCM 9827 / NBRC 10315 / NRRL Y-1498 / VKM Y-70) TaxID=590646 RepID=G3B624_CANTC|nr:uncharacterized protein CANTEDRAFT_114671 [Yamadazyma tenuis ATCC 10573]XP_006687442.1 uncharacterized protein CANTEDRAFT_114671 [Yamadazyma tenuis ATCC 10573]EGV63648.1 hypothetical protein CANTEDRAFT_114671 [Yamadazyma tenuis ATCC 10573]EGV63649.1 hypothetical protein CANTEDRAFT_114671 [Yamadazyma tenuis ATCC 10573]WEJ96815.1 hypothetical protein PSN45_004359 [Yamadazyma tenuis]
MLSIFKPTRLTGLLKPISRSLSIIQPIWTQKSRLYSTANPELSEKLIKQLPKRNTTKHVLSRKTFLVDYYKYLNDTNNIILYVHHNNLTKNENKKIRSDLTKVGAKLNVIRNGIYKVYLRSEHEEDPADKETSIRNKDLIHPLDPLLNGPTAIVTIPSTDPPTVAQVLKIMKSVQEKLILVGAKVEKDTFDIDQVDKFKDLPTKDQLQGQLAGLLTVLSGAGLVQTLSSTQTTLYLSLQQSVKDRSNGDES